MNVFTSGHRHQPWVWQITGLCFILGILLAGSLQTVRNVHRSGVGGRLGQAGVGPVTRVETVKKLEKEIASLRESKTKMENSLAEGDTRLKTLNEELQKVKGLAGLTEVKGPGIILVLQDSEKRPQSSRIADAPNFIIHDTDLQQAVNELYASGAEAIAINNQRLINRSAIRCVGPTIQVNGVPITPPFEIKAIGDANTLCNGLNLPLGVLDSLRRADPKMVRLEKRSEIVLPAYTGSTEVRYAKPVEPREKEKEEK
jgi:uncharacterized protein YlxW (UPF0749 family)